MIHFLHTSSQFLAVMCPVRLPVVTFLTPQRQSLIIADVRVVLIEPKALRVRIRLL